MPKKGLGIGLDALLGETSAPKRGGAQRVVPIEFIIPDPGQPRRHFDAAELDGLARSITEKGLLQPVLVRPLATGEGQYQLIAGERRWRAAQHAKLHEIPVIVKDISDAEAAEIAIIENVQRVDLNPIEEAHGYLRLTEHHGRSQAQIAASVGKSRSHIANLLRLVQLSDFIQGLLATNELTMGHARALVGAPDADALARQIIKGGLSVRETERLVKQVHAKEPASGDEKAAAQKSGGKNRAGAKNADVAALQRDLTQALGLGVTIHHRGKKGGDVVIDYRTLDELDFICARLTGTSF